MIKLAFMSKDFSQNSCDYNISKTSVLKMIPPEFQTSSPGRRTV